MISVTTEEKRTVVTVIEPRIEISNVRKFQDLMGECLASQPEDILLVMANVRYIDSSAMGALISLSKKVAVYGGSLKISQIASHIMDILRIAKIESYFEFVHESTNDTPS